MTATPHRRPASFSLFLRTALRLAVAAAALSAFCSSARADVDNGSADLVLGQPDFTTGPTGASPDSQDFNLPFGVAVDPNSGRLFISDADQNRVLWWNSESGLVNGQAADGVLGEPDMVSDGGGTSQALLSSPRGVAVDASGNLWVADEENERVVEFSPPFSDGMNASLVLGEPDFATVGSATSQAAFDLPYGVAVDPSGNVWVADTNNSRVVQFASPFSNGMNATMVVGEPDFNSSGGGNSAAQLARPRGLAFDGAGDLWVADLLNNRVVEFQPPLSNAKSASLVLGQSGFGSSGGGTSQTAMDQPWGVTVDSLNNVWVADRTNSRMLEFTPPVSNGMNAAFVLGEPDFNTNTGGISQTLMGFPDGATVDQYGNLFVTDAENDRVLEFIAPSLQQTPSTAAFTASGVGVSTIQFNWNSAQSGPYLAQVSLNSGFSSVLASSVTATSFAIFGTTLPLASNTTYFFEVSSNTAGGGPWSAGASTATLAAAPSGTAFTAVYQSSAALAWTQNNPSGTSYVVSYWAVTGATSTVSVNTNAATLTGLNPGSVYSAQVLAVNWDGVASAPDVVVSTQTQTGPAPGTPSVSAVYQSSVTITWSAVGSNGYEVDASTSPNFTGPLASTTTATGSAVSLTDFSPALSPNTTYYLRVGAIWGATTDYAASVSTATLAAPPTGTAFTAAYVSSATLSWTQNDPAGTQYQVTYWWAYNGSTTTVSVNTNSAVLTGLFPATTYFALVRAINWSGVPSAYDLTATTVTLTGPAPVNPTVSAVYQSSVSVAWGAVGAIYGYQVQAATSASFTGTLISASTYWATATSLTLSNPALNPNTTYYLRVGALWYGTTDYAATTPASIITLAAPPSGTAFTAVYQSSASLSWTQNDPAGTQYQVSYWTLGGATTTVSVFTNAATLTGLSPATTYFAQVLAVNWVGLDSASDVVVQAVTGAGPAPTNPTATAVFTSSATVGWGSVGATGGYEIDASTSPNFSTVAATLDVSSTATSAQGLGPLAANTTYYLRVGAIWGSTTDYAVASPAFIVTGANAPSGTAFTVVYQSSASLSWTQTNPAGTQYQVSYWTVGGGTSTISVSTNAATLSGLSPATTYYAQVRAINWASVLSAADAAVSAVTSAGASCSSSISGPVSAAGGSVTLQACSGTITAAPPAGALSAALTMTVLSPPASVPCPTSASPDAGLTPTGFLFEVDLNEPVEPVAEVPLTASYGGSLAGFDPSRLVIARCDAAAGVWAPLPSTDHPSAHEVVGLTNHFSVFQIMEAAPAGSLSAAKVWPNPFRPAWGEAVITFSNLPAGADIKIFDMLGEKVRELTTDAAGIATWDGKNSSGQSLATGVYFALAGSGSSRKTLKIGIVR